MKPLTTIALTTLSMALAGCANFTTVHRNLDINDGKGVITDIKQRVILVSKNASAPSGVVVCAEPSPDALSVYAAELAAKGDVSGKASGELSAASQESGGFTGVRTQTIQLLRDSRYRDCEAYMNGALDKAQYEFQARRHQKMTVALMAIEQLTGTVKAPPMTVSTTGSVDAARSISAMRAEIATNEKETAELEKAKTGLSSDEQKKIDAKIKLLQDDKAAISKSIEKNRSTLLSGTATAEISSIGVPTQRSDEHIVAVTSAVKEIVQTIIKTSDMGQLCFEFMQRDLKKLPDSAKQLQTMCGAYFQADAILAAINDYNLSKTDNLKNSENTDAISKIIEQMNRVELLTKSAPPSTPEK